MLYLIPRDDGTGHIVHAGDIRRDDVNNSLKVSQGRSRRRTLTTYFAEYTLVCGVIYYL